MSISSRDDRLNNPILRPFDAVQKIDSFFLNDFFHNIQRIFIGVNNYQI